MPYRPMTDGRLAMLAYDRLCGTAMNATEKPAMMSGCGEEREVYVQVLALSVVTTERSDHSRSSSKSLGCVSCHRPPTRW